VGNSGFFPIESLRESGQVESKGHLMDDVTRLDDVILVVICGVGKGIPPAEIFLNKNAIFHIFHQKFDLIGLQKFGGPNPLHRGATPLKNFYILNSACLGAFTRTLPWLD